MKIVIEGQQFTIKVDFYKVNMDRVYSEGNKLCVPVPLRALHIPQGTKWPDELSTLFFKQIFLLFTEDENGCISFENSLMEVSEYMGGKFWTFGICLSGVERLVLLGQLKEQMERMGVI